MAHFSVADSYGSWGFSTHAHDTDTYDERGKRGTGVVFADGQLKIEQLNGLSEVLLWVIAPEQQVFLPDGAHYILRLKEGGAELQTAKKYLERFIQGATKHAQFVASKTGGQTYDTAPLDADFWDQGRFNLKLHQVPNPIPPKMKGT